MDFRKPLRPRHLWTVSLLLGIGLFLFALISLTTPAQAAPANQDDKPSNDF